jgi:hypothetical protein
VSVFNCQHVRGFLSVCLLLLLLLLLLVVVVVVVVVVVRVDVSLPQLYYDKLHMATCFDFQEVIYRPF